MKACCVAGGRQVAVAIWGLLAAVAILGLAVAPATAQVNMPDPSEIHGKAIPAPELPDGTVTVRVVRESIGNNITGQDVSLTSEGRTRTVKTDDQGRAQFTNLPTGAPATATAAVNGEQLASEPFTVPTSGGLRVILVAGIAQAAERRKQEEAAALAEPAQKGIVVLGPNTRILGEFQDDALQLFYLFDITNNARTRVDIGGPLVLDLPSGAGGAAALEGSSQQATISGDRIIVTGPFAPGATQVQIGFTLPNTGKSYTLEQTFPVALQQVTVALEKLDGVSMTSSQFTTVGDVRSESGTPFILGSGAGLPAGSTLRVELTGLPAYSPVPRYVTLGLAGAILVIGAWMAFAGRGQERQARQRLIARRDTLLGELAQLEERRRAGGESLRQSSRRNRILTELEQIYGELDETSAGPGGGGEGIAA
jgi:hypothetical protein